jgi:hypothetical protein
MEYVSLKIRKETRVPTIPTLIQHSPGIPSQSNKARREIKGIQIGKEPVKITLFADGPKLLDIINSFSKVAG